ncbi:MAG: hypothetical protein MJY89_06000 [Bacteroidales bacterium]|nr:hypothetical protein [Bacteroidales bacterium]
MNIFKRLLQKVILSRIKDIADTSITPVSEIRSATLLVDWNGPDIAEAIGIAEDYFCGQGISLTVLNPGNRNFTLSGRLKRKIRQPEGKKIKRKEDLFISLATGHSFAEEYEAFSSTAKFKIGRSYFKPGIYDFLIQDRDGQTENQVEVLNTIILNIQKIHR